MLIGYARVSTDDQSVEMQTAALSAAGCDKIYSETISSGKADRPELARTLDVLREGDVLVVWKLDRVGRSLTELVKIVTDLAARKVGFKVLTGFRWTRRLPPAC